MTVDDVMVIIDRATEPKVMSKSDALDFLENIEDYLQARMESLREEMDE